MQLNLNLLTALDALLDEGSVMGAADRLHLSQPAMSRALGRIRLLTDDEILVRTGRTMAMTPYALEIRAEVHTLVQQATAVLTPRRSLDVATLDRTFTIRAHDVLTGALAPVLLAHLQRAAPRLKVRFIAETPGDTAELRHGSVDLELGATVPTLAEINHEILGVDRLAIAVRPGHALTSDDLTPASYASHRHVIVSRRGRLRDRIDDALAEAGLERTVVASVPDTLDALRVVRGSDLVTVVPAEACLQLALDLGVVFLDLPLDVPPVQAISAWHQRYDSDPAHRWLREEVRAVFRQHLMGAKTA